MFEIKMDSSRVEQALIQLKTKMTTGRRAVMSEIGEYLQDAVIQRFERSEGPDGQKWAANSESTIAGVLSQSKGNYKKKGGLTSKGQKRAGNKKPLIGPTKQLKNINYDATEDDVEVGSSRIYSRVQQFGAKQGEFGRTKRNGPIPWGDIPARSYLGFSDDDESMILDILKNYLEP